MNTETQHTPSIQDIVREETDNGMLIVRFLVSVIEGEIPDTKLWHRLDATRQLRKLGFDYAAALDTVRADRVLSPSKEPVEAPAIASADAAPGSIRAEPVEAPAIASADAALDTVRAEPVEAPATDTTAALRHSGIPATAGTRGKAGIQRGGATPTVDTVRAEPVEAPDPNTNGASFHPLPQGEGRGEGDPTDTNGEPGPASVGAVREPPIPALDPNTNGASFHPLPQGEGRGEGDPTAEEPALNGVEWPGGAPPIATAGLNPDLARFIRTETDGGRQIMRFFVDVMLGFLPMFKPHLRMDAAKELMRHGFDSPNPNTNAAALRPLPQSAGEGRDGVPRPPATNGTGPSNRHSGIPATAGTGEEAGIQWGGDTPATDSAEPDPASVGAVREPPIPALDPNTNGASFHPLPQGEGQGEGDALDYEPPYVNTYGHSEDDGFNTRAVFKAADALMDAVGRLPETPADREAARRSRKHSIIVHNGNEHYFSQCSRGAVESAIATREVMDAIRRIRDSCRTPSAFESVDDDHRSVRADPVPEPAGDDPEPASVGAVREPPNPAPATDPVRAEPVEAPHASVGAVREPPVPAPDPETNGADVPIRHSGIPAKAGTGGKEPALSGVEWAGIQRGGDAPAIDPARADPVDAPHESVRAEPVEAPASAGAEVPPLPQGEGRGEGDATEAPDP